MINLENRIYLSQTKVFHLHSIPVPAGRTERCRNRVFSTRPFGTSFKGSEKSEYKCM